VVKQDEIKQSTGFPHFADNKSQDFPRPGSSKSISKTFSEPTNVQSVIQCTKFFISKHWQEIFRNVSHHCISVSKCYASAVLHVVYFKPQINSSTMQDL